MRGLRGIHSFRTVVFFCFFISGLAGLVLEVVWARMLGVTFGNTVFAAGTVLSAFMLGLALGSAWFGRVVDRFEKPFMLYGLLEIGVGIYALLFPLLAWLVTLIYQWFFRAFDPGFFLLSAVRFIFSLLLIVPPATLMGGTLPVLSRFLGTKDEEPGREIGYLYAMNTTGAVAGCFFAGFYFLEWFGVRGSLYVAGGFALTVGALAYGFGRQVTEYTPALTADVVSTPKAEKKKRSKKREKKKTPPPAPQPALTEQYNEQTFRLVLIVFGIAGFCSLAYEVLWTRMLIFVMSTSLYAFSTMLTVFLSGIALGSYFCSRFFVPRVRSPLFWFGAIEILVGLAALFSSYVLSKPVTINPAVIKQWAPFFSDRVNVNITHFLNAGLILLLPTLLMGAAFPIVSKIGGQFKQSLGWKVGQIYSVNTIGNMLGAFFAGFVLIPLLGVQYSLFLMVLLNLGIGLRLTWQPIRQSAGYRFGFALPAVVVFLAFVVLSPSNLFVSTINIKQRPSEVVYVREHTTGTVSIHDFPFGERIICVDRVSVAGKDFMLRTTQKLQGYIPFILHPHPEKVVQIGFGSGETCRVGLEYGIPDYNVVDICPGVFEAGSYFEDINHGSYKNPKVDKTIMDGKNFALLSDETFDIVMNDSIYPGSSGSSALYSYDHFLQCRKRLRPGGMFSCWIPIDLRVNELKMILKSFQDVFPHTSLWVCSNCLNKHALILGSLEPFQFDVARIRQALNRPPVKKDLAPIEIHNVYDFLDCMVMDEEAIREFTKGAPRNTDNRPRLEISCALRGSWEQKLLFIFANIVNHHSSIIPYLKEGTYTEADRQELEKRFNATEHVFRALVAQMLRKPTERSRQMALALQANPHEIHVKSCDAELYREIEQFHTTLEIYPGSWELLNGLAERHFLLRQNEKARKFYEAAIAIKPKAPDRTYVNLAEIYFDNNQLEKAKRTLNTCLQIWPRSDQAHDRLAGLHFRENNTRLARYHIQQAVKLNPDSPIYQSHRDKIFGTAQ